MGTYPGDHGSPVVSRAGIVGSSIHYIVDMILFVLVYCTLYLGIDSVMRIRMNPHSFDLLDPDPGVKKIIKKI